MSPPGEIPLAAYLMCALNVRAMPTCVSGGSASSVVVVSTVPRTPNIYAVVALPL